MYFHRWAALSKGDHLQKVNLMIWNKYANWGFFFFKLMGYCNCHALASLFAFSYESEFKWTCPTANNQTWLWFIASLLDSSAHGPPKGAELISNVWIWCWNVWIVRFPPPHVLEKNAQLGLSSYQLAPQLPLQSYLALYAVVSYLFFSQFAGFNLYNGQWM